MRPDPHKQAASRRYQSKVRGRGGATGSAAGSNTTDVGHRGGGGGGERGGARGGRGGRGGYKGRGNNNQDDDEKEDSEQDAESAPTKSYSRRKIVSNADRYNEPQEEVTEAEELEQGIDRQTMAFRELLKDADQKKTFDPAAYFRFKSEKEVESQDPIEESQQARKLLEIRLDDIGKALMTLPIQDRLFLRDSDVKALDRDTLGKVSLSTGKPIVPKLVRGQAASDILIKPSTMTTGTTTSHSNTTPSFSRTIQGSLTTDARKQAAMDDDLDELLDFTKTYGTSRASTSATLVSPIPSSSSVASPIASVASGSSKIRLPPLLSKGLKPAEGSGATPATRGLPPPTKGQNRPAVKKNEEWLDSVLGI